MSNSSDYHKKWEQEHREQRKQYHKKWEREHREQRNQYKNKWKKENQNKAFVNIVCPYFIYETAIQISCESISSDAKCDVHRFKSKELKNNHRNCFCESFNYKKCPYARQFKNL